MNESTLKYLDAMMKDLYMNAPLECRDKCPGIRRVEMVLEGIRDALNEEVYIEIGLKAPKEEAHPPFIRGPL